MIVRQNGTIKKIILIVSLLRKYLKGKRLTPSDFMNLPCEDKLMPVIL